MKEPGIYRKAKSGFSMPNDRPIDMIWLTKSYGMLITTQEGLKCVIGFID